MIRVTPYNLSAYSAPNINRHKGESFTSEPIGQAASRAYPVDVFVLPNPQKSSLPWVKDENLLTALDKLAQVRFDKKDVRYVQALGVVLPFSGGQEALDFIKEKHIGIKFESLSSVSTHAQYDFDTNCILINDIYKNTKNSAEILAIAEAILHEAGHAKDQDGVSTVQEELDCLSMNAISHRFMSKNNPNIFDNESSLIIKDGVRVYADLLFDSDPSKARLVERLRQKYGHLPAGDFSHSPSELALMVKNS